jgi:serine protease Do
MAKSVMDTLIEHGRVVRGWLGVLIQDLDPALAESFGYEGTRGVLIGDVNDGSPADRAELRQGDIVISYDGKDVENSHELRSLVAATEPGEKIRIEVFRDGRRKTLYVKIGELEPEMAAGDAHNVPDDLGINARTLTPDIARQIGYDDVEGVLVTSVEPFSAAARAGIRANDVILSVQGDRVTTVQEFRKALEGKDLKKGIRVLIQSGANQRYALLRELS